MTIVPTKMYFNDKNKVKVEISLAKGKHTYDKKKDLMKKVLRPTAKIFATDYAACSELSAEWMYGEKLLKMQSKNKTSALLIIILLSI